LAFSADRFTVGMHGGGELLHHPHRRGNDFGDRMRAMHFRDDDIRFFGFVSKQQ
jgi:hypothetical protein